MQVIFSDVIREEWFLSAEKLSVNFIPKITAMNLKEYSLNLGITKWRTNIMKEIWVLTTDWAHDGEIGDNVELYEKEETHLQGKGRDHSDRYLPEQQLPCHHPHLQGRRAGSRIHQP